MPKKVITRRQRKAAEFKRQSEENARLNTEEAQQNGNVLQAPLPELDTLPSCSGVKAGHDESPAAGGACTDSAKQQTPNKKSGSMQQTPERKSCQSGKPTVKTIVKDQKTQSVTKVFDLLVDENIKKNGANPTPGGMQPPATPNEQGNSFSKSLTKRAAATFTKIQKLSRAFNKKMYSKQPQAKAAETTEYKDKSCSCEFCKVVLSQFLANKRRRPNDKKNCKNSNRLLAIGRRSMSPGKLNTPKTQPFEEKSEECKLQLSSGGKKTRLQQLREEEKEILNEIKKLNKQGEKAIRRKAAKEKSKPKMDQPRIPLEIPSGQSQQPNAAKSERKIKTRKSKLATPKVTPVDSVVASEQSLVVKPLDGDLSCAFKKLSVAAADAPPMKIFGNTGYFVLSGTDEQIAEQLKNLEAKNVTVERFVLLERGVNDILETQLDNVVKNQTKITERMRNKHLIMSPHRQRTEVFSGRYT